MDFIPQFKVYMNPKAERLVGDVLNSGYIGQGEKVEEFESLLKIYLEFDYGLTVNSGTSALMLALKLAGVNPGDYVISTPMTCSATNEAIVIMGAHIIWADVDQYGNIDPLDVDELIQDHTSLGVMGNIKALMAVDWGGLPCDYDHLRSILGGKIPIIEDAAHAYLATYKSESLPKTGGDFVCYSFQAIKHLTCGDGGFLVCPNQETYERGKLLRWFGLDRTSSDAMRCRQDISEPGYKFHMNDISASIGIANIHDAQWVVSAHTANAEFYDREFAGMSLLPEWPEDRESANWIYTIHVPHPLIFEEGMKKRGIGVSQVHMRNDAYTFLKDYKTDLPQLDKFFEDMVCIPVGWWLSHSDRERIVQEVKQYVQYATI